MVFTSLFKLLETDVDDVFSFLCRFCDDDFEELPFKDFKFLESALRKFATYPEKNFSTFIDLFSDCPLLKGRLKELSPNGDYGFFINGEDTAVRSLQSDKLVLVSDYVGLFGHDKLLSRQSCPSFSS